MRVDSTLGYQNIANRYDTYGASPVEESKVSSLSAAEGSVRRVEENNGAIATPVEETSQKEAPRGNISIEDVQTSLGNKDSSLQGFTRLGINSSDMRAAISAMQKDSVMQEYQYFVGGRSASRVLTNDQDGTVVRLS